jgi:hypothetical protein
MLLLAAAIYASDAANAPGPASIDYDAAQVVLNWAEAVTSADKDERPYLGKNVIFTWMGLGNDYPRDMVRSKFKKCGLTSLSAGKPNAEGGTKKYVFGTFDCADESPPVIGFAVQDDKIVQIELTMIPARRPSDERKGDR